MKYLAAVNNLEYGKEVKMISQGHPSEFKAYLNENKNKTLFGVLFCTSEWNPRVDISNTTAAKYSNYENIGLTVPCVAEKPGVDMFSYSIMYNYSLIPTSLLTILDNYRWNSLSRIKTSLDNGILRELHHRKTGSNEGAPEIENSESKYPAVPDRIHDGFDASAVFGSFYFYIPSLTIFSTIFSLIMKEKQQKLRLGLHVFGLSSASHWTAWTITAIAYS